MSSGGFGIPWGHTRSFLSRMYVDADIGQGYDWQVAEWPYLNSYTAGQLAFMGQAGKIVWFDQVGGANTDRGPTRGRRNRHHRCGGCLRGLRDRQRQR